MTRLPNTSVTKFEFYDKSGNIVSEETNSIAKKWTYEKTKKFYLKFNQEGRLMDPFDKFALEESYRRASITKCDAFKWIAVPESSWKDFFDYLKTKNKVYLRQIERTLS